MVLMDYLQKTKKECKNLKKQEIHDVFIKQNQIKLGDKAFNIVKNPNYDGYQRELASMIYRFFDKKASGSGIENEKILIASVHRLPL